MKLFSIVFIGSMFVALLAFTALASAEKRVISPCPTGVGIELNDAESKNWKCKPTPTTEPTATPTTVPTVSVLPTLTPTVTSIPTATPTTINNTNNNTVVVDDDDEEETVIPQGAPATGRGGL